MNDYTAKTLTASVLTRPIASSLSSCGDAFSGAVHLRVVPGAAPRRRGNEHGVSAPQGLID